LISDIHAGCWGGATFGFGDSGLFKALSSQLDFVGLHLLGFIVLDGLVGGVVSSRMDWFPEAFSGPLLELGNACDREAGNEGFTNTSLFVDVVVLLLIELDVPGRWPSVIVALLWLEVDLEDGRGELSLLRLLGPDILAEAFTTLLSGRGVLGVLLLRLLATELPRLTPEGDCTLHLLLTLSDLFIMALCTNPPIPFVGDTGLPNLSGEIRPWEGDIAKPRISDVESKFGATKFWALDSGIGDPIFLEGFSTASELLEPCSKVIFLLDGSIRSFSGFSARETSWDIPGICTLLEFNL
jgi:hypothetical protein